MEAWLGRDPRDRKKMAVLPENAPGAKYAYTGWQTLERYGNFTYIACKLKTGRTHQIRVHMTSTGHPLAGMPSTAPKTASRHWAANACTRRSWALSTRKQGSGCSLIHPCRLILQIF